MRSPYGALLILLAPAVLDAAGTPADIRYGSEEALRRYALGRLNEESGERAAALDEYYRALFLDPKAAEIARRVSEVAAHMGDPGRSLEFAERALAIDPGHSRSLWLKGAALLNLGRDREALEPLQSAAGADSTRVEYFRTLARAAERLDRLDLVARCYARVVWLDEEDGEAWFQLAAAEARRGRFGAADTAAAVSVALNPLRPGLFFLQGWIAERLGRLDDARGDYRRHLEIHPADQSARQRLVNVLVRERRHAEALGEVRVLSRAHPEDAEILHVEADLLFRTGADDEALRLLGRLRRERPHDFGLLSARVSVLARHGRARQAVREAEQWKETHPTDPRGALLAARARELSGDVRGALLHLEGAVRAAPDSLTPRVLVARTYQNAGRLREAERAWSEAAERFPSVTGLVLDLALCRERLGDVPGAEQAVRDLLAREPDNPWALNFLGYLFADHNRNLEEAVEMIRRALELDPENRAFLDSLGWAYYRLGRLEEARRLLERAVSLGDGDAVIHEHLGDVYRDLQLKDLARDQYRKSLASDGRNSRVRAKLSELR